MKRRNWMGHQRSAARGRKAIVSFVKRSQSKRKSWTFERLEDRCYFSATPVDTQLVSSSTPAGAAAISAQEQQWNELQWAAMNSSAASQTDTMSTRSLILPDDPLFASQWHLYNTGQPVGSTDFLPLYGVAGQDINVVPVWNMLRDDGTVGYTGKGVVVAVIDTGVQGMHPDLAANMSPTLGFNAVTGSSSGAPYIFDPNTGQHDPGTAHGTSVAGLIGAVWNNETGGSGVAPGVTLVPIALITPGQTDASIVAAFQYALDHGVDITNNSWGPADNRTISILPTEIYDVLRDSVMFGRGGLGMINVFASGNGGGPGLLGGSWDSASYDPFINSRYIIGVSGIDHDGQYANADGTFTTYPESGPDVLVASPTGSNVAQNVANDTGQGSGLWTTDLTGDFGFNAAPLPNGFDRDRDPLADPDYTSRFNGTSGATPIVSGVIALMLEANPNLTYRDVQEILVRSSRTAAWYESPSAARGDVITGGGDGAGLGTGAAGVLSAGAANAGSPGGGLAIVEDWGDAPLGVANPNAYPTTSGENGPHHSFDDTTGANPLRLGTIIDGETDGNHSPNADFDDNPTAGGGPDDEDGVIFPTTGGASPSIVLTQGQTITLAVIVNGAAQYPVDPLDPDSGPRLNVWIDFDPIANQGWDTSPAGVEYVIQDQLVQDGINVFTITVPLTAEIGTSFARFRLTSRANVANSITGAAPDGEVEDWKVIIQAPNTGGGPLLFGTDFYTTWQMNQTGPFRDPDPYFHAPGPNGQPIPPGFVSPGSKQQVQWVDPLADPSIEGNFPDSPPVTSHSDPVLGNDFARQNSSHYELMPGLFANGAGYTVSQGYGAYGDQVGYAHGVIDAELAVQMARQWSVLGQNIAPNTEKTVTTFVLPGEHVLAAEKMANNGMLIPGGLNGGGGAGFVGYWNEYNADPPAPFDPASAASWPRDTRGRSYRDFAVAPNEQINVEYVEVRLAGISGGSFNSLHLMLTSPDGTQSELNHYFADSSFIPYQAQVLSNPQFNTPGGLNDPSGGGTTWTFSSNRNWGESTNGAVILNAITGEPVAGPGGDPIIRNWELHIENWGAAPMDIGSIEIVWHGKEVAAPSEYLQFDPAFPAGTPGEYKPLAAGQNAWDRRWLDQGTATAGWEIPMAQRIQGSIGIDSNQDGEFNYDRYLQFINPASQSFDPYSAATPRADSIIRRPDFTDLNGNGIFDNGADIPNQEDFAANVVVSLYRVDKVTHQVDFTPTAYFLTGADGNFYFDVDPTFEWDVRINDPEGREKLTDVAQPANYMKDYQPEWHITPDWFYAPDHDNVLGPNTANNFENGELFKPGEVLWGSNDANGDGFATDGPMPYVYQSILSGQLSDPVPMAIKNVNFLLKATPPVEQFTVQGSVFADLNNNGVFDGNDARMPNLTVYVDANRNDAYENGETSVTTDSNGDYTLIVQSTTPGTFSIGVRLPAPDWQFKLPGDGTQDVTLPSFPLAIANFALTAPTNPVPSNPPPGAQGRILGVVFNDLNGNGTRELSAQGTQGELGKAGVRVFVDANHDGIWQNLTEASVLTASNGSFVLDNVTPGNDIWVDVYIADEGTANAALTLTAPSAGHVAIPVIGTGGTSTGSTFGVFDRAGDDWGDLPFQTLAADNGPHHKVVPGFQLGTINGGEVNGTASATSTADSPGDDGVIVVGGVLTSGVNTLRITVNGVGGLLTGWMDFNNNNQFDGDSEKIEWFLNGVSLTKEADLNPGTYDLQITIPASAVPYQMASRFRWGEPGLSFVGGASIGEVEDYFLGFNPTPGDYNHNGVVDAADFSLWKKQAGQNVFPAFSGADGNGDGVVDQIDYDIWKSHFGNTYFGAGSGAVALTAGDGQNSSPGAGLGDGLGDTSPAAGEALSVVAGSSVSSSSLLSPFVAEASHSSSFAATSTSVVRTSSASSDSSSSDLLLLDQTWANTGENSFASDHDSLYSDESHEVVSTNDLALAAVLSEEDEWWNAI